MNPISDKVLHYGRFLHTFENILDLMRSEYPCSVIIRGNPGSGKKTVIYEALKFVKVKCIFISPEQYSDDYVAIKAIASDLNAQAPGSTISDYMKQIRQYTTSGNKLVIVLEDFEDLCSNRQSLLYNLMNIMHTNPTMIDKGPNLTLIGLTCNLEWAENIEKRVRSRLNAKCIDLKLPYSNLKEYVEFASLLMDGHKIDKDLYEQLEYMYWFTNRSVRSLKKYLVGICEPTGKENKALKVNFDPDAYREDYQVIHNNLLRERLKHLTIAQLDLIKMAAFYCFTIAESGSAKDPLRFTLKDLREFFIKKENLIVDLSASRVLYDMALLVKLRLFKPEKPEQLIGAETGFYTAVLPKQLKAIVEGDKRLQNQKTDALWKKLR